MFLERNKESHKSTLGHTRATDKSYRNYKQQHSHEHTTHMEGQ